MKVKVSDISTINSSTKEFRGVYDEIQYLDTSSVEQGKFLGFQVLNVNNDTIPSRAQRAVKNGTILISTVRPNLRHYGYCQNPDDNIVVSSGFVTVDADSKKIDSKYLYYLLTSKQTTAYLSAIASTSVSSYPSFNPEDLGNYVVEIPDSISEQQKIAKVLSDIDSKIQNNTAICAELEVMAKLIYDYWFVQFDFPDENGKPYKSSGGKMVWSEELKREIPAGWEVKPLKELCSFMNGINYDKNVVGNKTYRIVNVRNITSSSLLLDDSSFDEITLDSAQAERYVVKNNDILIARSGTPGATRLLMNNDGNTIFCGFIIRCIPTDAKLRYYLTYTLKHLEGTTATKTGGSILQNVSQDTLGRVAIVIPNNNVIRAFSDMINYYHSIMQNFIEENQQLVSIRDFLLPMLMNGQVKVRV